MWFTLSPHMSCNLQTNLQAKMRNPIIDNRQKVTVPVDGYEKTNDNIIELRRKSKRAVHSKSTMNAMYHHHQHQ